MLIDQAMIDGFPSKDFGSQLLLCSPINPVLRNIHPKRHTWDFPIAQITEIVAVANLRPVN